MRGTFLLAIRRLLLCARHIGISDRRRGAFRMCDWLCPERSISYSKCNPKIQCGRYLWWMLALGASRCLPHSVLRPMVHNALRL